MKILLQVEISMMQESEKMVFNLYRSKDGCAGGDSYFNCGYYETDATEKVIKEIVASIKEDDRLGICDFGNAVITILKARGYKCEEYEIKSFGYRS